MPLRIFEGRYRFMADSPNGPVGLHLRRTGQKIEFAMKQIATEEKLVNSGRYRSSLTARVSKGGGGLILAVGSKVKTTVLRGQVELARLIEEGTPPHIFGPSEKKALWWDKPNDRGWMVQPDGGRPVPRVNHPGTRPYRVIGRAVERVLKGGR